MTNNERNTEAIKRLYSISESIYEQLDKGQIPKMVLPLRTKANIKFDARTNVWKYGSLRGARSAKKVKGAMMLLRTSYMLELIQEMIETNKSSTLREAYYISEGWGKAKFHSQDESNLLTEDLEIVTQCLREDFKLRPEENGASIIGDINIVETDRKGRKKAVNCRDDVGDSGYGIPYNVEKEKIEIKNTSARFVVAVETGGMFDRLVENGFDEDQNAILVHLKGQPARSTRRFIRRLNDELRLPVIVFTDGDPWSFRIYASVAYGAIKTAHLSEYLATPTAEFIGITASDIENYDLPTDKLTDMDTRALNAELKDPRFNTAFWKGEIDLMLKLGRKSEQQALAKYGLNFVTDTYLPDKLNELGLLKK
jgi:DNA topoisomerase-6 subunit A